MSTSHGRYTFNDGLTALAARAIGIDPELATPAGDAARAVINLIRHAAKARTAQDKASLVRDAQAELRRISPARHGKLVGALQTQILALQGRGRDTRIAHVAPGEMVIPRALQTPELMERIATLAAARGIDPRRLMVGAAGSVNPATGAEEFGLRDTIIKGWLGSSNEGDELDLTGIERPLSIVKRSAKLAEPSSPADQSRQVRLQKTLNPFGLKEPTPEEMAAHLYPNDWPDVFQSYPRNRLRDQSGGFWDIRKGGTHTGPNEFRYHHAIDQFADPGEEARAAITGEVIAIGNVDKTNQLKYITIKSDKTPGPIVRHLYVEPRVAHGDHVIGDETIIGIQQDIRPYYDGTPNHQHTEFYDPMRTREGAILDQMPPKFDYMKSFPLDVRSRISSSQSRR